MEIGLTIYLIGCLMCIVPMIIIKRSTGIMYWEMMQSYVIVSVMMSYVGFVILMAVCMDLKDSGE